MFVRFVSDASVQRKGFQATHSTGQQIRVVFLFFGLRSRFLFWWIWFNNRIVNKSPSIADEISLKHFVKYLQNHTASYLKIFAVLEHLGRPNSFCLICGQCSLSRTVPKYSYNVFHINISSLIFMLYLTDGNLWLDIKNVCFI